MSVSIENEEQSIARFMAEAYREGFDGLSEEDVEAMYAGCKGGERARSGLMLKESII